jgi:hypothetical protein
LFGNLTPFIPYPPLLQKERGKWLYKRDSVPLNALFDSISGFAPLRRPVVDKVLERGFASFQILSLSPSEGERDKG